jgi:drug/metabolite transporter (DMT)-like permease
MRLAHTLGIRSLPVAMLVAITAIWGWTFLVVKEAVSSYPPLAFLALRFALAAILLAPLTLHRVSPRTLVTGGLVGFVLAAGYLCQTVGLQTTTAANAGLLTGLFVLFTPILDYLLYTELLTPITVLSVVLSLIGTGLLTLASGAGPLASFHIGDALEVLTAIAFALHIVLLGRYSGGHRAGQLAFAQMAVAALVFAIGASIDGGGKWSMPAPSVWLAIVITGALASALAFWIQTFVQQRVSPARTAIILLAEPAFATVFAVWLGGERLTPLQWLGAIIILASLFAHETFQVQRSTA